MASDKDLQIRITPKTGSFTIYAISVDGFPQDAGNIGNDAITRVFRLPQPNAKVEVMVFGTAGSVFTLEANFPNDGSGFQSPLELKLSNDSVKFSFSL